MKKGNLICAFLVSFLLGSILFYVPFGTPEAQASNGFVTRSGWKLMLDGKQFRFGGSNIWWLVLQEYPSESSTPHYQVDEAFDTAKEMGETVVRTFAAESVDSSLAIEPSLGVYNETAFQYLDYAIKAASDHGIRLIISLGDQWDYMTGGASNYARWRGFGKEGFFTSKVCINDYKDHIYHVINRVNSITGIAYKNDPTIMAWETLNEPTCGWTTEWTATISSYIKSLDKKHLVVDGRIYPLPAEALAIPTEDIYCDHFYATDSIYHMKKSIEECKNANKVYLIGEYDWVNKGGYDSLTDFLSAIESNDSVSGDLFWQMDCHKDPCGYADNLEGFDCHYPNGDGIITKDKPFREQLLRTHAYKMSGRSVPPHGTPGTPWLNSATQSGTTVTLIWRGGAIAKNYTVERSTVGPNGPWTVVVDKGPTDFDTPWKDTKVPAGSLWYRVKGWNYDGSIASAYSNVLQVGTVLSPTPLVPMPTPTPTDSSTFNGALNSGFETGNLNSWDPGSYGVSVIKKAKYSGSYGCKLASTESKIFKNVVGLVPNTNYKLTARVKLEKAKAEATLGFRYATSDEVTQTVSGTSWNLVTVEFMTGDTDNSGVIYLWKDDNKVSAYVDDLILTAQ